MKKLLYTLAIIMALVLTGMQNTNAQTKVRVHFTECYDECTTHEDCVYRVYYNITDTCVEINELCSSFEDQACDQFTGLFEIICDGCTDETHNPCYRVAILLRKICIGPGGSHVICEGSDIGYFTCEDLIDWVDMYPTWN